MLSLLLHGPVDSGVPVLTRLQGALQRHAERVPIPVAPAWLLGQQPHHHLAERAGHWRVEQVRRTGLRLHPLLKALAFGLSGKGTTPVSSTYRVTPSAYQSSAG